MSRTRRNSALKVKADRDGFSIRMLRLRRYQSVLIPLLRHWSAVAMAELSVRMEMPPSAPIRLVNCGANWVYHKGTNSPAADWKTANDQALGWPAAPGGFGFAPDNPNETTTC